MHVGVSGRESGFGDFAFRLRRFQASLPKLLYGGRNMQHSSGSLLCPIQVFEALAVSSAH